jgi:photosystem II stability/assembly factor-like uncharacterized protein
MNIKTIQVRGRLMRIFVGALLGLAVVASSHAADPQPGLIKTIQTNIPHAAYFGIDLDGGQGVAVGAGGAISESSDAGVTWKPVAKTPTDLALLAVAKRGPHSVAVGQMGVVVVKDGNEWKKADSGVQARLLSVDVNNDGLAFAGGQFGTLLKSTDGGRTWASSAPDWSQMEDKETFGTGEPTVYGVSVDDAGQVTAVGEYGLIVRSSDGGASWRVLRAIDAKAATLNAVHIAPAGQGNSYAVGQIGTLLISSDGGETWMTCDTGTKLNFLGVAGSSSGHVVVTGMRVMYRSENNGMTWKQVEEGDTITEWYQAVRAEASSGRILAVGHSGKIIQIGS